MRRILSIDGGGMYGIVPAEVLARLEAELGSVGAPCPLHEVFDLMIGTSTGGVLALGLGLGIPATTARDLYLTRGSDIFGRPRPKWQLPLRVKYRSRYLEAVLQEELGPQKYMRDLQARVMVTGRNLTLQENTFLKSWDHPLLPCWKAAMATGSAPTFHSPVEIGGAYYTDGGLFASDPAFFGLVEAMKLWPEEEYTVLSLGTGERKPDGFDPGDTEKGLLFWGRKLPGEFLDGQADTTQHVLTHLSARLGARTYRLSPALGGSKHMDETDTEVLRQAQEAAADAVAAWAEWDDLLEDLSHA